MTGGIGALEPLNQVHPGNKNYSKVLHGRAFLGLFQKDSVTAGDDIRNKG